MLASEERMKKVKDTCTHYYDIVNFQFNETDLLTRSLIMEYKAKLDNIESDDLGKTNEIKVIDNVLNSYLSDSYFNRYVKENIDIELTEEAIVGHDLIRIIVKLYQDFRKNKEEALERTAWL